MGFSFAEWVVLILSPFVGSFLGVLITRLPKGQGVIFGRSRCPSCKNTLGPVDLVPILSYVSLRGRCRQCGNRIGVFYPFIEVAALGIAFWAAVVTEGAVFYISVILGWWLLVLALIDLKHFLLLDKLTLPLIFAGAGVYVFFHPGDYLTPVIGGVLGAGFFLLVRFVYQRVRGREGLGLGDVKLIAGAGALLGWGGLPSVLIWAVTGSVFYLLFLLLKVGKLGSSSLLPFGTFLCLGIWLTWLYGPILFQ